MRLGAAEIALAAAMNHPTLPCVRKPRVAIIANGDELVLPGQTIGPDQIVASNSFAIAAFTQAAGGEPLDLGIAADTVEALEARIVAAREAKADVIVTLGGRPRSAITISSSRRWRARAWNCRFGRSRCGPGKPLIHGHVGDTAILGLPGNPVSAIVCGALFLVPLIRALSGDRMAANADHSEPAVLGAPLPANDHRQDYLRATLSRRDDGALVATPAKQQDSSMLRVLASSECLLIRGPNATADAAGAPCRIIRLRQGW